MNSPSLHFPNPPLQALRTSQRTFALCAGRALKYAREVTPFAAVTENTPQALADLLSLMEPGEQTYVLLPDTSALAGVEHRGPFGVVQMTWPEDRAIADDAPESPPLEPLSCADAADMVALTDVAFPGFFRRRTCEMGQYYGVRIDGNLVAMCGERMAIHLPGEAPFHEISGLCTHPGHRGKGYASVLLHRLLRDHRAAGIRSYLHASTPNRNAIALYQRMGFDRRGEFPLYRVTKPPQSSF